MCVFVHNWHVQSMLLKLTLNIGQLSNARLWCQRSRNRNVCYTGFHTEDCLTAFCSKFLYFCDEIWSFDNFEALGCICQALWLRLTAFHLWRHLFAGGRLKSVWLRLHASRTPLRWLAVMFQRLKGAFLLYLYFTEVVQYKQIMLFAT